MMLTRLALWRVLQCVAVCCSVSQCVAVCCSVLQCVAVCCSVATTSGLQKVSGLFSRRDQQIEDLFEKNPSKNPQSSKKSLIYFEIVCAGDNGFVQERERVCVCVCVGGFKEPCIF